MRWALTATVLALLLTTTSCSSDPPEQGDKAGQKASGGSVILGQLFHAARAGEIEGLRQLLAASTVAELDAFFARCYSGDEGWRSLAASLAILHQPGCREVRGTGPGYRLACSNLSGEFTLEVVREDKSDKIVLPTIADLGLGRTCPSW